MGHNNPLRGHRDRTGQSLQAVGSALKVSRATVWGWEKRRRMPTARDVAALADHFGLNDSRTVEMLRWFANVG